ncbi:MAG: amidohydrolase family protein [Firmicutes bacterium]|nr:amidohydrolase family protein [Bacillota bacterium]
MEFFDCNCWFGVPAVPPLRFPEKVDELLEEMSFCGVSQALVYHVSERDDSPLVGNQVLIQEIEGRPGLYPVWAILPSVTGEQESPDKFVARMKENSVMVLRAFPAQHKYLLNANTFGPLFEVMVQKNIPLIVGADWSLITGLLEDFPRLTLIAISSNPWGQDRYFRPLIEKYPNLYLDTSRYELDWGLKAFCNKYGPERMLFGTGFPDFNMGGPILTLLQTDIPDEYKAAIGSENLKRLLRGVRL